MYSIWRDLLKEGEKNNKEKRKNVAHNTFGILNFDLIGVIPRKLCNRKATFRIKL